MPAAYVLAAVAEHEVAERNHRRIERHLAEAKLLPGKTLDSFEFEAVSVISKALVVAICAGNSWIDNGWCVMFTRNSDLVQRLQVARRELALEAAIAWLDRFDLLILDDFAYISKDQAETSVLFELVSARYERRSMLITANQPFGEWGRSSPIPL